MFGPEEALLIARRASVRDRAHVDLRQYAEWEKVPWLALTGAHRTDFEPGTGPDPPPGDPSMKAPDARRRRPGHVSGERAALPFRDRRPSPAGGPAAGEEPC